MKVGVVIPCLRYFQGLAETVATVQTQHTWTPYVIPNWRLQYPLSRAWNTGIERAIADGCEYIAIVNDDILFSPWTIDAAIEELTGDVVLASGHNIRSAVRDPYETLTWPKPESKEVVESPDFACFVVGKDIHEQVGKFDENFDPCYFEDNDYHYRIKILGYKAVRTTAAPYYHFGSQTQNAPGFEPACPGWRFEALKGYFVRKWGGLPTYETFTTPFNQGGSPKDW